MNGEQIFLNELKDYINSGMSKNDLKTLINQRLKEVENKQCNIAGVVGQSEQLPKHCQEIFDMNKGCPKGTGCRYPNCYNV